MKLPPPEVGMVIRYSYLWSDEQTIGREEGAKDRPALVLAVAVLTDSGRTEVMVLAITHTPPRRASDAVVLPVELKRAIGLDQQPAWIVTTEANAFVWPGPDLRPVKGKSPPSPTYGRVPAALLRDVALSYLANRKRQLRTVQR